MCTLSFSPNRFMWSLLQCQLLFRCTKVDVWAKLYFVFLSLYFMLLYLLLYGMDLISKRPLWESSYILCSCGHYSSPLLLRRCTRICIPLLFPCVSFNRRLFVHNLLLLLIDVRPVHVDKIFPDICSNNGFILMVLFLGGTIFGFSRSSCVHRGPSKCIRVRLFRVHPIP